MAGIRITDLPRITSLEDNDNFVVARGTSTKRIEAENFFNQLSGVKEGVSLGIGQDVFESRSGTTLQFNSLSAADGISLVKQANTLKFFIANDAIPYAKIENIASNRVLGRSSAGTGNIQEVQVQTGMIADDAITFAKIQNIPGNTLLGRNASTTGAIGATTVETGMIQNGAVTFEKINFPVGFPIQIVQKEIDDPRIKYWPDTPNWDDIFGFSVAIKIKTNKPKIRVQAMISGSSNNGHHPPYFRILRNGTLVGVGDGAGNRTRIACVAGSYGGPYYAPRSAYVDFMDDLNVNAGSTLTYKVQWKGWSSNALFLNRGFYDNDQVYSTRAFSSITVTEIKD